MSFTGQESLQEIVSTLKSSLPGLKEMLRKQQGPVSLLHPMVEMTSALIQRYERGEIIEKR